ncbi:hypothetical protein [Streptomyces tagetis]|uniref:Uncharacterized protein n=1 Tax=Streptomyces tagetis TaxID=2820809 RepID=A0A940XDA0_9ACTN|nr:hypothetical protein [Streptomyces sp. RG38]MBQ0826096.1 hypothetical protein [Streptomyces sp. RG38]
MHQTVRLDLLGLADSHDDELLRLRGQLRRLIADVDVVDVQSGRSAGGVPEGAKSGELIAAGSLVVTATSFILRQLLLLADTWLKNRPVRGIRVEREGHVIELTDATTTERARLIDEFLAHHEVPPRGGSEDRSSGRP